MCFEKKNLASYVVKIEEFLQLRKQSWSTMKNNLA